MKVELKKEFAPIIVTLETEEEAVALWYLLGLTTKNFDIIHPPVPISYHTYNQMWNALDCVYRPPPERQC